VRNNKFLVSRDLVHCDIYKSCLHFFSLDNKSTMYSNENEIDFFKGKVEKQTCCEQIKGDAKRDSFEDDSLFQLLLLLRPRFFLFRFLPVFLFLVLLAEPSSLPDDRDLQRK